MESTSSGNFLLAATAKMMQSSVPPIVAFNPGLEFHANFFNLMQSQIEQLMKNRQQEVVQPIQVQTLNENNNNNDDCGSSKPVSQFSIESLLKDNESNQAVDEEHEMSSPSSSSNASSSNTYTLQSLKDLDRRTNMRTSSNSSSQRYPCDKCGKSYATTSNLSRHKQTHRPIDSPYAKQCPHCDRRYVSMPALSMHILTHNASHECHVCGKLFSRLWLLQGHLRSHTGIRPFSCAQCGKSFSDRSNLRAHIFTHTGDKRHQCDNCGRRFALRAYLNRHVESCLK